MLLRASLLIFALALVVQSFCQFKNNAKFVSNKGPCTTTYILDSTGFYFTSVACDQSSTVAFGKYRITSGKVFFHPLSFDSLPPFASTRATVPNNDTAVRITFLARYNKLIPDKNFTVDAIDVSGKYYKRFFLNDAGAIVINPARYKTIRINYLDHFYARWIYVPVKTADVVIQLSLPQEFFFHHHPVIKSEAGSVARLKADGLYSLAGTKLAAVKP